MSLYGYGLPTTPRIDALAKTGNLAVFTDTITPQTYTEGVLQQLLTFSNAQNAATPWFEQENLLDLMKLFGYKTLCNQENLALYNSVANTLSKRADKRRFTSLLKTHELTIKDEALLGLFAQNREFVSQGKSLIVFHLMGAHANYARRYPKELERFTPQKPATKRF